MLPYWLLKLLPMWSFLCPSCQEEVEKNSRKCVHCGERYGVPLRVPPRVLKDGKALEDYVHREVFPRVSAEQREYLAQWFTTFFSSGFETEDDTFTVEWTGFEASGTTPSVVTSFPHHGSKHAQIAGLNLSTDYCYIEKNYGSGIAEAYIRAYIRFEDLPTATATHFFGPGLANSTINSIVDVTLRYDGANYQWGLHYYQVSGWKWVYGGNYALLPDTWYCVELHLIVAALGTLELWVNGVSQYSATGVDTNDRGNIQYFMVTGDLAGTSETTTLTVYFDCVVVADAYIGPEARVPTILELIPHPEARRKATFHPRLSLG